MSNIKQQIRPLIEYKQGFKTLKEATTTSPSRHHFGHHHALLVPN